MRALVITGGVPQLELISQLKAKGIVAIVVDGSDQAIGKPFADIFYHVDVLDMEAVKKIAIDESVDFVISVCADQVLLTAAWVSEQLGLPCYIDYETAVRASSKSDMKKTFCKYGIPTSNYVESEEYDESNFANLRFPLVVKPVDAYSAKGVRKAHDLAELEQYYRDAKAISRTGEVVVEEFCSGTEITVDAFVVNGKAHLLSISNIDTIKEEDRFVIFRGRHPSTVSEEHQQRIAEICQMIADAYGLDNSPLLIQLIDAPDDVYVLEFCTRTGGNMKYLLIKYATGVDVIGALLDVTLGIEPDVQVKKPAANYVMNDFVYCKQGNFDHLEGFEELLAEGVITEYRCIRSKGHPFNGVKSSSDRIAGATILADTLEELNEKQRVFASSVRVISTEGKDMMRHDLFPEVVY